MGVNYGRGVRANVFINDQAENVSAREIQAVLTEAGYTVEAVRIRSIGDKEWDTNVNDGRIPNGPIA